MALWSYCTCRRADARGTLADPNGFKCRIQFQDELVEITQGNVEITVTMVIAGFRVTGMLIDCLLRRVQADSLTHSQNVIGYHMGHAFSCRHLIKRAQTSGTAKDRDTMDRDQLQCLHWNESLAFVLFAK